MGKNHALTGLHTTWRFTAKYMLYMFLVMRSYLYNNYVKIMTLLCDCDGWIETCEVWPVKITNLKWLLFMLDQFLCEITVYTPCLIVLTKRKGWNYCQCLFFLVTVHSLISLTISSPQIFSFQVPTVPPGNVQAEAVNSTTVRFTWSAPSPQFINGINQGYKVSIHPLPSSGRTQDCRALFIIMVSLLPIYVMLRQQQDSHWLVLSDSGHICPFFFFF